MTDSYTSEQLKAIAAQIDREIKQSKAVLALSLIRVPLVLAWKAAVTVAAWHVFTHWK